MEGSTAKQIMIRRAAGFILFAALALGGAYAQDHAPAEPEAYRNDNYRAPTPKTLRGARTVSTVDAETLWRTGTAAFVDVMPHVPRPANLPAGTLWRDKPRSNIPGSIWLPDTGYGQLSAVMEGYLRAGLEQITGGDRAKLAGDLLSEGLLDVVERRQAGGCVGLQRRRLVPRRHRRLARRWTSTPAGTTDAASRRVNGTSGLGSEPWEVADIVKVLEDWERHE